MVFHRMLLVLAVMLCGGCNSLGSGNNAPAQIYSFASQEPAWIRGGVPIAYENKKWYPADDYEVMSDAEVLPAGQYKGMTVFVEKIAAKPYHRIYTKFDKNKFRYWEPRHD